MAKATVAKKYSKTKFTLYYNYEGKSKENYAELVGAAVYGLGRASTKKHGKHLVAVYYDHTDVTPAELSKTTESLLLKRGLYQVEQPSDTSSNNRTIGIIYADVLSYLASWDVLNLASDDIEQLSLFSLTPTQRNIEKLTKVREILSEVKSVDTKIVRASLTGKTSFSKSPW